jgi:hypothetical protein
MRQFFYRDDMHVQLYNEQAHQGLLFADRRQRAAMKSLNYMKLYGGPLTPIEMVAPYGGTVTGRFTRPPEPQRITGKRADVVISGKIEVDYSDIEKRVLEAQAAVAEQPPSIAEPLKVYFQQLQQFQR